MKTIKAALLGAMGVKTFIESHGGLYIGSRPEGRIVRGKDAAATLRAEGFEVSPWMPEDPNASTVATARAASRTNTFVCWAPVGAVAV